MQLLYTLLQILRSIVFSSVRQRLINSKANLHSPICMAANATQLPTQHTLAAESANGDSRRDLRTSWLSAKL